MPKPRQSKITYSLKKFQIGLQAEQNDALQAVYKKPLVVLQGRAGSGKTLVGVYSALSLLNDKEVNRIIITRPTVSDEEIGFLPGDLKDKMDPWMAPVFENLNLIIGNEATKTLIDNGILQIKPIAYMRGQTFTKCAIIVDEAQNVTHSQMEMILGRLGRNSKMIVCGDIRQKDLHAKALSGFPFLVQIAKKMPEAEALELITNHRHSIVDKILEEYELCTTSKDCPRLLVVNG